MSFDAEFIIPPTGIDNLRQPLKATITFLKYSLEEPTNEIAEQDDRPGNYSLLSQRLNELLDDVHEVRVDIDKHRNVMTLMVAGKDKAFYPARSLSDGTLRFLALGILELSNSSGVLCLEEPENGIHPTRIGSIPSP